MRKLFFVIALFIMNFSWAQQAQTNTAIEYRGVNAVRLNNITKPATKETIEESAIAGSKYREENYKSADVYLGADKLLGNFSVRYNAYNDEMEIMDNGKKSALLKEDDMAVVFKNYMYKVLSHNGESRYFVVFNGNQKTSLVLRAKKIISKPVKPSSGLGGTMPATFTDDDRYYIRNLAGNLIDVKLKKKDILRVLGNKKSEIEKFVSSRKLSYKKENDLVAIVDYYNTL
ncbi:hypothetical protein M0D21_14425 [Aquimarina sp. D1M17]|uniref:hypothetical protein n=1 Tax=Aquimarina acroporae TaxID=2937283 RepID=UPI0020BF3049|nr:hypothetical protein [Aquimarina acroporae]MCK8522773.1 hypothetical protein [Aquimarina acroporae]